MKLSSLRYALRRHRRLLAALAAALAMLCALSVIREDGDQRLVLIAAHDIPGGATLSETDLSSASFPSRLLPVGAIDAKSDALNRTVVAAISEKSVITTADFLDAEKLVADGAVALPLTFGADAPVSLLHVGSHIDILGTDTSNGAAKVIAPNVRVISLPQTKADSIFATGQQVVLVEVSSEIAAKLTAASGNSKLSFALL